MKIGNVELDNPYILAPMAGVTDLPFRLLCKEQGAGLLCMEMVSAKALQYKNKNTKALLAISDTGYQYGMSGAKGRQKRRRFGTYEESETSL